MSDYGSDAEANIPAAQLLAFQMGLLPGEKVYIMQWTKEDGKSVRKIASRKGKSNLQILFQD